MSPYLFKDLRSLEQAKADRKRQRLATRSMLLRKEMQYRAYAREAERSGNHEDAQRWRVSARISASLQRNTKE